MKLLSLIPPAVLLTIAPVFAQGEAPAEEVTGITELDFMQIIDQGGVMMYPLALLSVVAMVLILLYLMTIRRNTVVSDRFMNTAEAMIRKRDFLGLIGYCHRQNQCMARITQKSLEFMTKNSSSTFGEIREIAESEGSRQAGMLSSRVTYLSDIGSIAPMIGLLGTVLGMIKSFLEISTYAGVKQMGLASGVSEALVTTATGLAIGIPSLVFYSIFRGRVQKYVSELEAATTHLMAMLHAQVQRQAPAQAPPAQQPRRSEEYAMPVPSPLSDDRPDLHGI